MLPGTCAYLTELHGLRVVHNPEFLTAARPLEDFKQEKVRLLGGDYEDCARVWRVLAQLNSASCFEWYEDTTVTELAKYMHNTFLAVKVGFCNEIYGLCEQLGIEYDQVRAGAIAAGGIGPGHTAVPGPDGSRGFGGACFPKDTAALVLFANNRGVPTPVLFGAILGNCWKERAGPSLAP